MKKILLQRLTLENFKNHKQFVLELGGKSVTVYGENAAGKSSLYDALTWLLFGKDGKGRGESEHFKPVDKDGNVRDHEAITAVTAELTVDGLPVVLKRTLQEKWSAKRGSSALSYDGNESEYFVDGVPCKKFEFARRIGELVDEDVFRLLTELTYFVERLDWRKRRSLLCDLSGAMSDKDIMRTDAQFAQLLEDMGGLSPDDYKKKIAAERKGLLGVKNDTPARLSELGAQEAVLCAVDYAALHTEQEALELQKDVLSQELYALRQNTALVNHNKDVMALKLQIAELEQKNGEYRRQQEAGRANLNAMRMDVQRLEKQLSTQSKMLKSAKLRATRAEADLNASRERWLAANDEQFTGGDCPTCGQALPIAQLNCAKDSFEEAKQRRLDEIVRSAGIYQEALQDAQEYIAQKEQEIDDLSACLKDAQELLQKAEQSETAVADLPEYAEQKAALQAELLRLEEQGAQLLSDSREAEQKVLSRLAELRTELGRLFSELAKEELLGSTRRRIAELRKDAQEAEKRLEEAERKLYLIEEFTRYKTRFVEDSINCLFCLTQFRLFREQANGGIEERCDAVFDGVPYADLNDGMRVNVGMDVIRTLSGLYGVSVPLFIDNAERVTDWKISPDTQVIRLAVSKGDKELRCEYETEGYV